MIVLRRRNVAVVHVLKTIKNERRNVVHDPNQEKSLIEATKIEVKKTEAIEIETENEVIETEIVIVRENVTEIVINQPLKTEQIQEIEIVIELLRRPRQRCLLDQSR